MWCRCFLEFLVFSRCVARVPVSLYGYGGWGCVRSTLRLCSQPSSNRSQPSARSPYGRAYGKFCKRVTFGRFTCCVASFRVADVALRDIQTCFVTFFVWQGAILLRLFQTWASVIDSNQQKCIFFCWFLRSKKNIEFFNIFWDPCPFRTLLIFFCKTYWFQVCKTYWFSTCCFLDQALRFESLTKRTLAVLGFWTLAKRDQCQPGWSQAHHQNPRLILAFYISPFAKTKALGQHGSLWIHLQDPSLQP